MKIGALRGAGFLIVSLLLRTVVGYDVPLGRRQEDGLVSEPVTVTVTIFTQFTFIETTTTTVDPTQSSTSASTPIVTVTSTEKTTTTTGTTTTKTITVEPKETGDSDDKRKRQVGAGPITVTSTATLWKFPDATETSTVTVTASLQTVESPPEVSPTTTTEVTTETSTVTAEETVTTFITSATSSASATGSKLLTSLILEGDHDGREDEKISGPHLAIILGATFGAVLGAVIVFAVAYLWTKKRRDERLEKEFYGEAARPPPPGGKGIKGFFASVLDGTRFTTRYNTLPNTDRSAMSLQNRPFFPPLPSHSPPPQLPALRVDPPYDYTFTARSSRPPQLPSLHITPQPGTDFTCEYTFGSPVSSIGETHLHSLTSMDGMEVPLPLVPRTSEQAQPKKGKEIVSVVPLTSEPPPASTGNVESGVLPKMSIKRKPVP